MKSTRTFSKPFRDRLIVSLLGLLFGYGDVASALTHPNHSSEAAIQPRGAMFCSRWNYLRNLPNSSDQPPAEVLELATVLGWINGYVAALEMERKTFSTDTDYDAWWKFLDKNCVKFPDYELGRMVEALFIVLTQTKTPSKVK
jgi:hypothetical protein